MASVKPLQVREPSWLGECTLRRLQGASTSRSHAFGSLSVAAFFSFLQRPSLFISLSLEEKWQLLNFYRSLNFIYKQRPASWLLILIPNSWERVCDRPAWCNRESDLTFDICPLTWFETSLFFFPLDMHSSRLTGRSVGFPCLWCQQEIETSQLAETCLIPTPRPLIKAPPIPSALSKPVRTCLCPPDSP